MEYTQVTPRLLASKVKSLLYIISNIIPDSDIKETPASDDVNTAFQLLNDSGINEIISAIKTKLIGTFGINEITLEDFRSTSDLLTGLSLVQYYADNIDRLQNGAAVEVTIGGKEDMLVSATGDPYIYRDTLRTLKSSLISEYVALVKHVFVDHNENPISEFADKYINMEI